MTCSAGTAQARRPARRHHRHGLMKPRPGPRAARPHPVDGRQLAREPSRDAAQRRRRQEPVEQRRRRRRRRRRRVVGARGRRAEGGPRQRQRRGHTRRRRLGGAVVVSTWRQRMTPCDSIHIHTTGPIYKISYDNLTIIPKLRSTYDGHLIYKTSCEGRKDFLRYDNTIHLQSCKIV